MIDKKKLIESGFVGVVVVVALVVAIIWAVNSAANTNTPRPQRTTQPPTAAASPPSSAPVSAAPPTPATDSSTPPPGEDRIPTTDPRTPITTPGKSGTPRGLKLNTAKVDRTDADAVAVAFATLCGTYDTKIDNSPNDAGRRASMFATAQLATQMRRNAGVTGPDAAWATMAAHHAYTTVHAQQGGMGEGPQDTTTQAVRGVTIVLQQHGDHGWQPAPNNPETLLIWLHRSGKGEPWSVSEYRYR
jgi:hypothetical protein